MKNNMKSILALTALITSTQCLAVAESYKTQMFYDNARKMTGEVRPDPDGSGPLQYPAVRHTYNSQGLLQVTESGELSSWPDEMGQPADWGGFNVHKTISYTYDNWGAKLSETVTGSQGNKTHIKQYSYDALDRVQCEMVRNDNYLSTDACIAQKNGELYDRVTRFTYNTQNKITEIRKAVGTPLEQAYKTAVYQNNLLSSVNDANGNKTGFSYDGHSRLKNTYYPHPTNVGQYNSNDYVELSYDVNGNVSKRINRDKTEIDYQYDNNNRLILKDLTGTVADVHYGYTNTGLETYARFGSENGNGITNVYNGFGELVQSTDNTNGTNRTISFRNNKNGMMSRLTFPDNKYFEYEYDETNRFSGIEDNAANQLISVSYRSDSTPSALSRNNNSTTTYTPDELLRVETIAENLTGTNHDVSFGFQYNNFNQIERLEISNQYFQYTGNENTTGTYTPNGLNQYSSVAGKALAYDLNGNLTNDGLNSYIFDAENRLKTVTGSKAATFNYDPKGRLAALTIAGVTTHFLYAGDALVAEYNSIGTMVKRYVHGSGTADWPLLQYEGAATDTSAIRYFHKDHQQSITALTNSTGTVVKTYAYDTYGIAASGNDNRFGYTGQHYLKDLGLYHYKARVYHPKLGRFLQTDPVGYEDQMNLYAYVGNDPINYTDPSGKVALNLVTGGIGALVGGVSGAISARLSTGNWSNSVASFGVGAAAGGLIGATFGASAVYAAPLSAAAMEAGTVSAAISASATSAIASGAGDAIGQVISTGEVKAGSVIASTVSGALSGPWSSLAKSAQFGAIGQAVLPSTLSTLQTPFVGIGAGFIDKALGENKCTDYDDQADTKGC
ncbi:hypothetical protein A5320_17380 [Rheinheimera sp. SA_1]|uniref:RHS repeat-associated core domain-containing protein n=1 Tax=Rheinheimera sp. SA_1 TaxID=1827365 RepID=UPI00080110E0|nr:RHS repeat-associated core domain-containing protein [Rheinheimera sp. SA_1]OBP13692.1 hypothetical protein A5320_17380 [Rheinheimera sp. SA_1]